jgi:polyisoprenoid-binding protein YceI
MTIQSGDSPDALDISQAAWRLDPTRSSVEFHVRHFYGLATVKGRFERFEGTLNLRSQPAIQLTIEADSLDTKHKKRDQHLHSADFFNVAEHPQVQFVSDSAALDGEQLTVRGKLSAAGKTIPLHLDATLHAVGDELEVEAVTNADHRGLEMTWSPLGVLRAPSKLLVHGRLVRQSAGDRG